MQSFWEFRDLKLPLKFALAIFLLSAGLVFMGASYYQTIVLEEAAQKRADALGEFSEYINDIKINRPNFVID